MLEALHTPHRRADVLLVTGAPIETSILLEQAERQFHRPYRLFFDHVNSYYDLGCLAGARVVVAHCEMGIGGPDGVLLAVDDALKATSAASVIVVGVAFGRDDTTQRIGDVLIARELQVCDMQPIGSTTTHGLAMGTTRERLCASPRLLPRFQSAARDWHQATIEFGLLLSCQRLADNLSLGESLMACVPSAIGGELEGAGACAAADRARVDWIVAKAIYDWADGHKRDNKSERQHVALTNASSFVLATLQAGGLAHRPTAPLTIELDVHAGAAESALDSSSSQPRTATCRIGDPYFIRLLVNDDCYVTVLCVSTTGTIYRLSPDTSGGDGFIPGRLMHSARPHEDLRLLAAGPTGVQTLLAFATRGPHALSESGQRGGLIVCSPADVTRIEQDYYATDPVDRAKAICHLSVRKRNNR